MIHRKYDTSEIWYIDKPATYCIDESSQFSPDRINCLVHIICNKRASQFVGEREKATCSPIFRVPVLEAGFRLSPAVERPHWTSRKISSALWGWGGGGYFTQTTNVNIGGSKVQIVERSYHSLHYTHFCPLGYCMSFFTDGPTSYCLSHAYVCICISVCVCI